LIALKRSLKLELGFYPSSVDVCNKCHGGNLSLTRCNLRKTRKVVLTLKAAGGPNLILSHARIGLAPTGSDASPLQLAGKCRNGKPILDGFAFEGLLKFTADFSSGVFHGFVGSLSPELSVRQTETASDIAVEVNANFGGVNFLLRNFNVPIELILSRP
jgi:hypothetical protein